jgi:hypothetical protein
MSRAAGGFELWRQDDHGRHFLVGCYATLVEAELRLAELTRTPHKQSYWINSPSGAPDRSEPV